jgi:hypothetical protein
VTAPVPELAAAVGAAGVLGVPAGVPAPLELAGFLARLDQAKAAAGTVIRATCECAAG